MTELVTDEMVEIAAIKAAEAEPWMTPWLRLEEFQRRTWRVAERAALTAVAPLIAAREREACAKVADDLLDPYGADDGYSARAIAAAIRARNT